MIKMALVILTIAIFGLAVPDTAFAVMPDEKLEDPALEARAREISKDLRCLVCQNQSIDDSDADLARDLRVLVRERLSAGDTNAEVKSYVVDRYGEFVLLTPPFKASTFALWVGPAAILIIGIVIAAGVYRRHSAANPSTGNAAALSAEERRRVEGLLNDDEGGRR